MVGTAYHFSLPVGTRIEEYEISSVLGQGSFGMTYLAEDTHLGTKLAIKEYLPGDWAFRDSTQTVRPKSDTVSESFERGQEAFLKEARLLARVAHPNIVKVRRFFRANGTAYIAMDFIEGATLGETLSKAYPAGGYPSILLKKLLISILSGLRSLHEAGIIHRDIKPGNILIEPNGNPVLVDFGAARNFDPTLIQGMTVIITPGYAPIEQYSDDREQGPFTDIYALGALAYRAITGHPPDAPYKRLGRDSSVSASVAGAGKYPAPLLSAIDWALAVQPHDRPQTAAALLDVLEHVPDQPSAADEEPTQLLGEATQIIEPSRWRGTHTTSDGKAASIPRFAATGADDRAARHATPDIAPRDPSALGGRILDRLGRRPLILASLGILVLLGAAGLYLILPASAPNSASAPANPAPDGGDAARAEAARQETTRREAERQSAEAAKREADRQAAEAAKREADRVAAEAARQEAERQSAEAAKREADRVAAEAARAEAARQEAARQEAARQEAERQSAEAAKREADRQATAATKLKAEKEAADAARAEAQRAAAAKQEADRQAAKLKADQQAAAAKRANAEQAAKAGSASPSSDSRCTNIVQTTQLTGALSDEDRVYLRDHCR